jgi:hypothetical protein
MPEVERIFRISANGAKYDSPASAKRSERVGLVHNRAPTARNMIARGKREAKRARRFSTSQSANGAKYDSPGQARAKRARHPRLVHKKRAQA